MKFLIVSSTNSSIIFVHTPFCATCQLAERMLKVVDEMESEVNIYRLNASMFPEFMQEEKIESVPALIHLTITGVSERLYAFESVPKIYEHVLKWKHTNAIR